MPTHIARLSRQRSGPGGAIDRAAVRVRDGTKGNGGDL
eukprot:gene12415-4195_t